MPITSFAVVPSRLKPSTFAADMDALLGQLNQFVAEANALESNTASTAQNGTSTTSLTIATGAQSLASQTGKGWATGQWLYIINSASPANYMVGSVTSYTSATGALAINITTVGGSGTAATWVICPATPPGTVTGLTGGGAGQLPWQSAASTTAFLAAGTAGQVLQSGGTGAPSWTSAPAVTTQAITDASTKAASTAYTRAVAGGYAGIASRTTAATLQAADANVVQLWSGTSAATLTLPAASAIPAGMRIPFIGVGSSMAAMTLSRAGTDTIMDGEFTGTSMTFAQNGFDFALISNGSNGWIYEGPRRRYESAWISTLWANNTAVAFTHGLGVTPRNAYLQAECIAGDGTFYVGDRIMPLVGTSTYALPPAIAMTATSIIIASSSAGWYQVPRSGGATYALTASAWKYRAIAEV